MSKKRMRNGAFFGIWCTTAVLCLGVAVALEVLGNNNSIKTILNTYVNRGKAHVEQIEGSEKWDSDYYNQKYPQSEAAGGNADAAKNGEALVEKVGDEGMVLLKNKSALPLATTNGITLLGRGSVDPVYGGSGSGNVDTTTCANPKSGLEKAGFTVDADAYAFFSSEYQHYDRQVIVMDDYQGSTFFIGEIPVSKYNFTVHAQNTAVVFISRCGGEGLDLSTNLKREANTNASKEKIAANANTAAEVANYVDGQHQLELSKEEKEMVAYAKEHYAKTIIVLNESTTMEIGELMDDEGVDGIIWAGSPGSKGFNSLGKILAGTVNPSGRTPDIYARDFTKDPTFINFAINSENEYTGIDTSKIPGGVNGTLLSHFVQYEEGIYVGYKYYETRALYEASDWYDAQVAVPFGYGLSYTTFSKELVKTEVNGNDITMTVKVTNTGNVAGKEVVQLYYTAPYTAGGIEKASTVLADFAKTNILAKGASEEIKVSLKIDEMASYDYKTEKAYVLDAGDYVLQIKDNSHTVAKYNNANLEYTYNVGSKRVINQRESDKTVVTNRFDDVSAMFKDEAVEGYARNMSRQNFASTFPTPATAADAAADKIVINGKTIAKLLETWTWNKDLLPEAVMPTIGATNGLTLSSLRGVDYDDPEWDLLLDQLTEADLEQINNYIVNNAYIGANIESLGISAAELHDGPQGFSTLFGGLANVCAYMSEPLLAATFNKDLAEEMGTALGEEALALQPRYTGWYGPAMNTHRSPFAGRNFEYYSEDGVLGGKIAARVCVGAANKGVVVFIKHFALNDQETWRTAHLCTYVNEQALRENYLKPFEIAVKEAKSTLNYLTDTGERKTTEIGAVLGVMSSFNYIGTTWAGGRRDLMTDVLRNEWGFRGVASSDFNLYDYMIAQQGAYAGTDLQLTWASFKPAGITDTATAAGRTVIRTAIKNLAYAMANSNALQGVPPGSRVWYEISPWRIWFYIAEGVLGAAGLASIAWIVIRTLKVKKEKELEAAE